MTTDTNDQTPISNDAREQRRAEAAKRARAEAEARRAHADAARNDGPVEKGGQDGPDPTRYGDWEKAGIVSDF